MRWGISCVCVCVQTTHTKIQEHSKACYCCSLRSFIISMLGAGIGNAALAASGGDGVGKCFCHFSCSDVFITLLLSFNHPSVQFTGCHGISIVEFIFQIIRSCMSLHRLHICLPASHRARLRTNSDNNNYIPKRIYYINSELDKCCVWKAFACWKTNNATMNDSLFAIANRVHGSAVNSACYCSTPSSLLIIFGCAIDISRTYKLRIIVKSFYCWLKWICQPFVVSHYFSFSVEP